MLEVSTGKLRLINYFLVTLILAAVILLVRDTIIFNLSKEDLPAEISKDNSPRQPVPEKKNIMQYSSVLEKNPFGAPMTLRPLAVTQSEGKEAAAFSLSDLILVGTAFGSDNLNYAIFEDRTQENGQQEIVRLGENVFNYGKLKKIERSSVEIERGSVNYTVTMPEIVQNTDTSQEQAGEVPQASFAKQVGEREYILDSRRIQSALENPQQILTHARLLPNIKDGRQEGFSISEVVPGGIYSSLGLRNGDILLRINGLEMSNPEVAIQAMSGLKGMSNIDLDVIRNGRKISMNYRIK